MRATKTISAIEARWKTLLWLKMLLGWIALVALSYLTFASHLSFHFQMLLIVSAAVVPYLLFHEQLPQKADVNAFINQQLPELEYSVSLLNQSPTSGVAQLQRQRVMNRLAQSTRNLDYPIRWNQLLVLIAVGAICATAFGWAAQLEHATKTTVQLADTAPAVPDKITNPSSSFDLQVTIKPPPYIHQKSRSTYIPHLREVLSGSTISWHLTYGQAPKKAWLTFANGDSLTLRPDGSTWSGSYRAWKKGFYAVHFVNQQGALHSSEYYQLEVIPDEPPEVEISGIAQYQSIQPGEAHGTSFQVKASDVYGLTDAYLVATITKGSGESVKFREEKIPLSQPVSGKRVSEHVSFTPEQFDMEPGNELYFYLEAWDNQVPAKGKRTETYFFTLKDTAEIAFSLEGDLGIDLMPEYFRSQRQIIIDSEKLLQEKASIAQHAFNERSNELGFDQKALRLKYGQFIGEEAESGLDIANEVEEEHETETPGEVDVLAEFGHDHDHEHEEGQHLDNGTEQHEDPLEALTHSHDDMDQATFLEASMKAKLRAALKEMWDAELYLRLFNPRESLPYQYKALKLIKEIKNHARIYVHRMGFDAPPINEAKSRLTGDLAKVHGAQYRSTYQSAENLMATKRLVAQISARLTSDFPIDNSLKDPLQQAGNELAVLAIENPAKYIALLSDISKMANQQELTAIGLRQLQARLLSVLPMPTPKPQLPVQPSHELLEQFVQELTRSDP